MQQVGADRLDRPRARAAGRRGCGAGRACGPLAPGLMSSRRHSTARSRMLWRITSVLRIVGVADAGRSNMSARSSPISSGVIERSGTSPSARDDVDVEHRGVALSGCGARGSATTCRLHHTFANSLSVSRLGVDRSDRTEPLGAFQLLIKRDRVRLATDDRECGCPCASRQRTRHTVPPLRCTFSTLILRGSSRQRSLGGRAPGSSPPRIAAARAEWWRGHRALPPRRSRFIVGWRCDAIQSSRSCWEMRMREQSLNALS